MAIPINGPVQGLAISTAKKPVINAFIFCLLKEIRPTRPAKGLRRLTISSSIRKIIVKITIITPTKTGDCS